MTMDEQVFLDVIEARDPQPDITHREQRTGGWRPAIPAQRAMDGHGLRGILDRARRPQAPACAQGMGRIAMTIGEALYGVVIIGSYPSQQAHGAPMR